jgi:hypothetical protein
MVLKMAVFWVVALVALMTEAAKTSETSVNFYQTTRRYNPEDSHLRTHSREKLISYLITFMFAWQLSCASAVNVTVHVCPRG